MPGEGEDEGIGGTLLDEGTETVVETPAEVVEEEVAETPEEVAEETAEQIAEREAEEARRAALTDEERAAEDAERLAAAGAPETYEDFTAPEGVTLNAETTAAFAEQAKADNLTQAQAQKYVDMATGLMQRATAETVAAFETTVKGWREAAQNDPEIGGENKTATVAMAHKAIAQFGDAQFKELLGHEGDNALYLGNHPAVLRFLSKVGKALTDDGFVAGGSTPQRKSLYNHPTSKPKKTA